CRPAAPERVWERRAVRPTVVTSPAGSRRPFAETPPMPPLPPTKEVLDAMQYAILPAAGGAALVAGTFLVFGRWAAALGSAAAVAGGFAWANYTAGQWLNWGGT